MENNKGFLCSFGILILSNLLSFGLIGGGSLTLINNADYPIYLRQVPIAAIWAFLSENTDPVEFSDHSSLPSNSTSLPASWAIYSVGVKTTSDIPPIEIICSLGFITNEERKETDIDLLKETQIIKIDDCNFIITADLMGYDWTWPTPHQGFHSYDNVRVSVTQQGTCVWGN